MPDLNPAGGAVPLGRLRLRTPGLRGTATLHLPATPGSRGAVQATRDLEAALEHEGIRTTATVEIRNTREVPASGAGTRSTQYNEPAIELAVPAPNQQWDQVVLAIDESGVMTWNFPVKASPADLTGVTRDGATGMNTFVIRRYVPTVPAAPGTRGLAGAVGKKVLKVLVFPLVEEAAGQVGDYFAHRWEQKKRSYRLRGFEPETRKIATVPDLVRADWDRLGKGRALLLLHGTFSRAHTGFGSFDPTIISELNRRYDGRVFAFDHFPVSETPTENVERLIQALPEDARLDLDILSHSRGGLVARVLAERQSELSLGSRTISVRRVVFAATPNQGTVLANPDHYGAMIDTVTNVLQFAPDNGVTETFETIITVAKHLAVGAMKGLEGLGSMHPTGRFLTELNDGPRSGTTSYFAIASDFEPTDHGWQAFARDRLTDAIFGHAANDLVVPTGGVYEANQSGYFPIADPLVFTRTRGIAHSDYFRTQESVEKILTWLQP